MKFLEICGSHGVTGFVGCALDGSEHAKGQCAILKGVRIRMMIQLYTLLSL